jgi:hypothetical protein
LKSPDSKKQKKAKSGDFVFVHFHRAPFAALFACGGSEGRDAAGRFRAFSGKPPGGMQNPLAEQAVNN